MVKLKGSNGQRGKVAVPHYPVPDIRAPNFIMPHLGQQYLVTLFQHLVRHCLGCCTHQKSYEVASRLQIVLEHLP
jgi:hypothetical protein